MAIITKNRKKNKFQENHQIDINEGSGRISSALAVEIGFNESIILLQLDFLISITSNFRDGRFWTYQSLTDLLAEFPYLSETTINRALHSLEEQGLIVIGNYNVRKYDRTRWFAIVPEGVEQLRSVSFRKRGVLAVAMNGSDELPELDRIKRSILRKIRVINPVIPDDKLQGEALGQLAMHVSKGTITENAVVACAEALTNGDNYLASAVPTSILQHVSKHGDFYSAEGSKHPELYDDDADDDWSGTIDEDDIPF